MRIRKTDRFGGTCGDDERDPGAGVHHDQDDQEDHPVADKDAPDA